MSNLPTQNLAPDNISEAYRTRFFRAFCPDLGSPTGCCGRDHCKFVLAVANKDLATMENLMAWDGSEYCHSQSQGMGRTRLHLAALHGRSEAVENLLLEGKDINCRDDYGNTPFALAMIEHQHGAADLLVRLGADINCANKLGRTILHEAAWHNWRDSTDIMLCWGQDRLLQVNYFDQNFQLPVDDALSMGNYDLATLLVKFGAITAIHSKAQMLGEWVGDSAFHYVWRNSPLKGVLARRDLDLFKALVTPDSVFRHHLVYEANLIIRHAHEIFQDAHSNFVLAIADHFRSLIRQSAEESVGVNELLAQLECA
ncbi:MAG: ankyrin repeat domain-containing protein [Patescibacteria group bacterium]|jgi:hypothetical protein